VGKISLRTYKKSINKNTKDIYKRGQQMEDFYLELEGGRIKITEENGEIRFEVGALHLEDSKITTITFFLNENELNKLGECLSNARL